MRDFYEDMLENEEAIEDFNNDDSTFGYADGVSTEDCLGIYFKEIGKYKCLTKEEEIELAKRIENGDKDAREQFILANTRLVVNTANKYVGNGVDFEDLCQEGNYGLIKAVDKFDYRKGNRFSTFAIYYIVKYIIRCLEKESRTIRLSSQASEDSMKLNKEKKQYIAEHGVEPTDEWLAIKLGFTVEKVRELKLYNTAPISLDTIIDDDEESTLYDITPDENSYSPRDFSNNEYCKEIFAEAFAKLPKRSQYIVALIAGLDEEFYNLPKNERRSHTIIEVAKKLNISRERVRQIYNEAKDVIAKHFESYGFNELAG